MPFDDPSADPQPQPCIPHLIGEKGIKQVLNLIGDQNSPAADKRKARHISIGVHCDI
jgi:hypothetical protein